MTVTQHPYVRRLIARHTLRHTFRHKGALYVM